MSQETLKAGDAAAQTHTSAPGMPQLDFTNWDNQIFWLLVTLAVIFFVLSRIALPRIASVLAERQGAITKDLAEAERLKAKAAEAEDAYNQALADARAAAQTIVAENKAQMQAELKVAIEKADAKIAEKLAQSEKAIGEIRAGALDAIKTVASDTAAELISAVGGKADASAIDAAVAERMKG